MRVRNLEGRIARLESLPRLQRRDELQAVQAVRKAASLLPYADKEGFRQALRGAGGRVTREVVEAALRAIELVLERERRAEA